MSKELDRSQDFFSSENETGDALWKYVQSLSSETISQLSKPDSIEVFQVMEQNVIGLLGSLPSEHFNVTISTNRDHLGKLLASAMMSGYFLRNAEQRLNLEQSLQAIDNNLQNDNINELKILLANKTTEMLHGKKAALNSEQAAKEAFSGMSLGMNLRTIKSKSKDIDK